ncbi:MAG: lipid-A-disaccharide synthase [Candidatus Omnitrophica bacterium]|jgi:lipid-A-disaccharide synthase|nr:lipid-A-disaccharide synthase [Candidatus Omnitrophota bacterium]
MAQIKKILIVCGEPSGDLLAGNLAAALKSLNPEIKIIACGGKTLAQNNAEIFYNIKDLAIMGLFDVLKNIPKFLRLKKIILQKIASEKPDAIILVDFSGFNLRLAKEINNKIPTIYYVSPQIWASRPGRIRQIKRFISKMIVLFKFEEDLYQTAGVNVSFAGHPIVESVKPTVSKEDFLKNLGLDPKKITLALLPGSRKQEIKYLLPVMLQATEMIARNFPQAQFVIAKSNHLETAVYQKILKNSKLTIKIVEGKTSDCLNASDLSLVCSGTATLEAGLIGKPFLIIYKMNLLNYLLYRPQIRVPCIGIINIIAGKKIIPEFIQFQATAANISRQAITLLNDQVQRQDMQNKLSAACLNLGLPGASKRAAEAILNFLNNLKK